MVTGEDMNIANCELQIENCKLLSRNDGSDEGDADDGVVTALGFPWCHHHLMHRVLRVTPTASYPISLRHVGVDE